MNTSLPHRREWSTSRFISAIVSIFILGQAANADEAASRDTLLKATHDCAAFLVRMSGTNGQFSPRVNSVPGPDGNLLYSVMGHAEALLSLATYQKLYPKPGTLRVVQQAADTLRRESLSPLSGIPDALTLAPYVRSANTASSQTERLDATAIGLTALLAVEQVLPGSTSTNTLRGLGHFIRLQEREDGSFQSPSVANLYRAAPLAQFSPGEAARALLCLNDFNPNPEWWIGARAALVHEAKQGTETPARYTVPWSLIAIAKLLKRQETMLDPSVQKLLQEEARHFARLNLQQRDQLPPTARQAGALSANMSTAHTALLVQGLLAALSILPGGEQPLRENILRACDGGVQFLIHNQVKKGSDSGAFPRIPEPASSRHDIIPDFSIHIFEAQHALMALIMYDQLTGANWL
jgi:hypothetical protein